ncbi:hypothetical protein SK128_006836 [Halocaridina rubra]|uniref:Uncharacterized protein n=1 Tax=Halocaridina rubra TaxID=373956 RepID=A0AAN8WIV3_HALRR
MSSKRKFGEGAVSRNKRRVFETQEYDNYSSTSFSETEDLNFDDNQFNQDKAHELQKLQQRLRDLQNMRAKAEEMELSSSCYAADEEENLRWSSEVCENTEDAAGTSSSQAYTEFDEIKALYSVHSEVQKRIHKNAILYKLGYQYQKKKKRKYDDTFYDFPPGVGVPPENIEDIPEECLYWPHYYKTLRLKSKFTENEIIEDIKKKIEYQMEYFDRLEEGKLTKEEKKKGKLPPENFHGPYLPTPKHLRILKNLDIQMNWPLTELQKECFSLPITMFHLKGVWRQSFLKKNPHLFIKLGQMTRREGELIVKNWQRFQKEYKFYDIRPLIALKTSRFCKTKDGIECVDYNYLTRETRMKFLMYLLRGVPERIPFQALFYLKHIAKYMINNELVRSPTHSLSYYEVYGTKYLARKFNYTFLAMELVLGQHCTYVYSTYFYNYIAFENIPIRYGQWLPEEYKRLEKGILAETGCKSLKDSVGKPIKWVKLLPYVRTRLPQDYIGHYKILLLKKEAVKKQPYNFSAEKQLIER